jgi:hypothetical protein
MYIGLPLVEPGIVVYVKDKRTATDASRISVNLTNKREELHFEEEKKKKFNNTNV